MRRLTVAVVLLALALAAPALAQAAIKPPKPPTPPVIVPPKPPTPPVIVAPTPPTPPHIVAPTPPSLPGGGTPAPPARVTLEPVNGYLVLRVTGLTVGTEWWATYAVYGCGNPNPYYLGVSGPSVRSDGTLTVGFISAAELYYYAQPNELCEVVAYLTAPGSRAVATYPDGEPIRAEHDFYG